MARVLKDNIVETTQKECGRLKARSGYRAPILSRYDRTRQQRQELFMNVETRSSQSVQFNKDEHTELKRQGNSLPAAFLLSFLIILPSMPISAWCAVQAQPQAIDPSPSAQTTLAIFTDQTAQNAQPISDSLWIALVNALDQELTSGSPEVRTLVSQATDDTTSQAPRPDVISQIQIIRGDRVSPGLVIHNSISVYLHGECTATSLPRSNPFLYGHTSDALGWVRVSNGSIEPFIHVDCTHIAQLLGPQRARLNSDKRDQLMAGAIARVILHEWIHISTQSSHHARNGITKAQFGVADLLAHTSKPQQRRGTQSSAADRNDGIECSKLGVLDSSAQCRLRGTK